MGADAAAKVTQLLNDWYSGSSQSQDRLFSVVNDRLRDIAAAQLRKRTSVPIQPTDLVGEAYLRFHGDRKRMWRSRKEFWSFAVVVMRNILHDRSRRDRAQKRDAQSAGLEYQETLASTPLHAVDELAIKEALERLAARHPTMARIVALRFFLELPDAEIGRLLGISERTVRNKWHEARDWLGRQLTE